MLQTDNDLKNILLDTSGKTALNADGLIPISAQQYFSSQKNLVKHN